MPPWRWLPYREQFPEIAYEHLRAEADEYSFRQQASHALPGFRR